VGYATRLHTYIDRYPAKMVGRLAEHLIARYAKRCARLLDPFCGSGAILKAATKLDIPVVGVDVNPYAVLLSRVKVEGFRHSIGDRLCQATVAMARGCSSRYPIDWLGTDYWFTPATIQKYERLRHAARELELSETPEGRAVLLAFALSIRRCSRADQRSPKPFISRYARERRRGRHFDPIAEVERLYWELRQLYGRQTKARAEVFWGDILGEVGGEFPVGTFSHVVTSPPYINAQDYFRNCKLELYLLEGVLPFEAEGLKWRFVGTERGPLLVGLTDKAKEAHRQLLPVLGKIERRHPRQAAVVQRYLYDMGRAFDKISSCVSEGGVVVVVCGDNLVGGHSIATWAVLNRLLEERGFALMESFGDEISCRNVPPRRMGHKGLIKREVVSAFVKR